MSLFSKWVELIITQDSGFCVIPSVWNKEHRSFIEFLWATSFCGAAHNSVSKKSLAGADVVIGPYTR